MPCYEFVCTQADCKKISEKIVRSYSVETIDCPECGAEARRAKLGEIPGGKGPAFYFNYLASE